MLVVDAGALFIIFDSDGLLNVRLCVCVCVSVRHSEQKNVADIVVASNICKVCSYNYRLCSFEG